MLYLTISCISLFILAIVLILRVMQIKRQIRNFMKVAEKLKNNDYNQPIKVDYFDHDLVALANVLNSHIKIQKNTLARYNEDKRQLKDIIAGISHDFRTPLTAAKGYLQMINNSNKIPDKETEYLSVAIEKTNYLKELSDEFFEVTKLKACDEPFETEEININTMFTEAILEQNEWIEALKIKTQFDISDETIIINSNKHYLMRIIDNLFSNSKKYTSKFIGTKLMQKDGIVTMCIYNDTDNYDLIDTKKVFEPFYHSKAKSKEGSGLGLYIVKDISDKLGFDVNAFYDTISCINVFTVEIKMKALKS